MLAAQVVVVAQDEVLFLGEDFFPWMVLALGAAMVVGNVIALVRPPAGSAEDRSAGRRDRPPMGRAVAMIVIGLVAAGWGAASLLS